MGLIAVQSGDRSLGGCMHRRFTVITALLAGAFAAIAALPLVSSCQRRPSDTSFLAADAQAAAPTTTAETVKQVGPMPSLAPLVKQLRPVRSEEHTSELQSQSNLVCRLLLEKKKKNTDTI